MNATGFVGINSSAPITALDLSQTTGALALPVGATSTRPTGAGLANGELRYNTSIANLEAYVNGAWSPLSSGSASQWLNGTGGAIYYSGGNVGIGTTAPTQALTVSGNIDAMGASGYLIEIANAATTGTAANKLAKLASGKALIAATTDTDGELGVVVGNAGTVGNAQIATAGQAACAFDGATTAGDYVTISSITAGDCHDAGAARPAGSQSLGVVLSTNASAGTYAMVVALGGTAAGNIPTGTIAAFASLVCPTGWTEYTASRGLFLRGYDNGAGIDPSGNRAVGNVEADMLASHTHSYASGTTAFQQSQGTAAGSSFYVPGTGSVNNAGNIGSTGGAETRPKNIVVMYCQYVGTMATTNGVTASGTINYDARWTNATTLGIGAVYDNGTNVSIGTSATGSVFSVNGNAAIGGSYAAIAAPTNGMIVQGNVGIGTSGPTQSLDVRSDIRVANNDFVPGSAGSFYDLALGATSGNTYAKIQVLNAGGTTGGNLVLNPVSGNVGIETASPAYTLQVNGSVAGTSAYNNTSDARLKKNVQPIAYGLETVMRLRPISFDWIAQDQEWKRRHQLGLIAQEVAPVVPEVVTIADDKMRTRSLAYGELVPVLIKAIQDLKAANDALRAANDNEAAEIGALKTRIDALEAQRR